MNPLETIQALLKAKRIIRYSIDHDFKGIVAVEINYLDEDNSGGHCVGAANSFDEAITQACTFFYAQETAVRRRRQEVRQANCKMCAGDGCADCNDEIAQNQAERAEARANDDYYGGGESPDQERQRNTHRMK